MGHANSQCATISAGVVIGDRSFHPNCGYTILECSETNGSFWLMAQYNNKSKNFHVTASKKIPVCTSKVCSINLGIIEEFLDLLKLKM